MDQSRKYSLMMRAACPLIIGAALYAGHAQADSKIYGLADVYVGVQKLPGSDRTNNVVNNGGMSTSFLGFSSSEAIDGGLKAGFTIEGFYRLDTGAWGRFDGDTMFARNAFVSLGSDSFGSIQLGRNTTPYFISTVVFNPLGDSYTFSPTVWHTYLGNYRSTKEGTAKAGISGIVGDSGWNNSIRYNTPDMGGFNASLIYALGEKDGNSSRDKWGGNIGYGNGPFGVTLAYQQVKLNSNDANSVSGFTRQDAAQFGISYDFNVVKVFAQYQYIKNRISDGDTTSQGGFGGVSVPVGNGNILAEYGYSHTKIENSNDSVDRNSWAVSYDYNLSKRTDVYVAYFNDDVSELSNGYTAGIGMRTRF